MPVKKKIERLLHLYNCVELNPLIRYLFKTTLPVLFCLGIKAQPCLNEGFESSATGQLPTTSASWTVSESNNSVPSIICPATPFTFMPPSNNDAIVQALPFTDPYYGTISSSPFAGSNILQLNKNSASTMRMARVTKTFSVTSGNWFYRYAFRAALQPGHDCCYDANVMFRFYDCAGNYLSPLSTTIVPTNSVCFAPSACRSQSEGSWLSSQGTVYNSDWIVHGVNLSTFIGSCITVEVLAANCYGGVHHAYVYFDDACSDKALLINGYLKTADSHTVCSSDTLSAPPCFGSYLWQGPAGSGISGLNTATLLVSASGVYTLTMVASSNTVVQTQSITVIPAPSVAIVSPGFTLCQGQSITLTAGVNAQFYTWSNGTTGTTYTLSPQATTVVSLTGISNPGCRARDTKTITVLQNPTVTLNSGNICRGNSFTLTPAGAGSYTFQDGSAVVSPTVSTTYSVAGTGTNGCTSPPVTATLEVFDVPTVTASSGSVCLGGSFTIMPAGAFSYTFSSGPVVSPTVSSSYTVTGANTQGCSSAAIVQVDVADMPRLSWPPKPLQCLASNAFIFDLTDSLAPGAILHWDFTSSATPSVSDLYNPGTVVFSKAGIFPVSLFAQYHACRGTFADTIMVVDPARFTINWDTTVIIGQPVALNAFVGNNYTYSWTPVTQYLNCSSCLIPDPVSHPANDITYTLLIEDNYHCHISKNTYRIVVDFKISVDVPTAFTPNGDGINDLIRADGWGLKKLQYFKVFNRWGQLLFESDNLDEGWDGTLKGVPQNAETYIYQVSVETYVSEQPFLMKTGTFKLIR